MTTVFYTGHYAAPLHGAPRYATHAALVAAIRAASLAAPEDRDEPGPGRRPEDCAERCGPPTRNEFATAYPPWRADPGAAQRFTLSESWHGPLRVYPARVAFFHAIGSSRGSFTLANLRGDLTRFGDRIERAAQCFDGKTRKPRALPGIKQGAQPHVTARALWKERDYSGALQVAESCGAAAYFGASDATGSTISGAPIIYMRPESIAREGAEFMVARRVDTGRFHVTHAASGRRADTVRTAGSERGFATGAAAMAWFDEWLADDSNRDRLRAALATGLAPISQTEERARCEAAAAPSDEPADTGAEPDATEAAAETDSGPVDASTGAECSAGSCAPADAPSGPQIAPDDAPRERAADAPEAAARAPSADPCAMACGAPLAAAVGPAIASDAPSADPAGLAAACLARFGVSDPDACRHLPAFADAARAATAECAEWAEARRMLQILKPRLTFAEDWRAEAKHQRERCGNGMPAERIGAYLALATLLDSGAESAPANPLPTHSQGGPVPTHSQATETRECTAQFHGAAPASISRARASYLLRAARSRGAPHRPRRTAPRCYSLDSVRMTLRTSGPARPGPLPTQSEDAAPGGYFVMLDHEQSAGHALTLAEARTIGAQVLSDSPFACTVTIQTEDGAHVEDIGASRGKGQFALPEAPALAPVEPAPPPPDAPPPPEPPAPEPEPSEPSPLAALLAASDARMRKRVSVETEAPADPAADPGPLATYSGPLPPDTHSEPSEYVPDAEDMEALAEEIADKRERRAAAKPAGSPRAVAAFSRIANKAKTAQALASEAARVFTNAQAMQRAKAPIAAEYHELASMLARAAFETNERERETAAEQSAGVIAADAMARLMGGKQSHEARPQ